MCKVHAYPVRWKASRRAKRKVSVLLWICRLGGLRGTARYYIPDARFQVAIDARCQMPDVHLGTRYDTHRRGVSRVAGSPIRSLDRLC